MRPRGDIFRFAPLVLFGAAAMIFAVRHARESAQPPGKRPPAPRVARGWVGFEIKEDKGVVRLESVFPGGPAEAAGLEAGDVILRVGTAPATSASIFHAILEAPVGTAIVFERMKKTGERGTVSVTVELASGTEALLARTITKGARGLAALQRASGLWPHHGGGARDGVAASALACAALAAAGESAGEPGKASLERGTAALLLLRGPDGGLREPGEPVLQHRVYANALLLLALSREKKQRKETDEVRAWLASAQIADEVVDPLDYRYGGFPYYESREPGTLRADVSVAAWALEALAASGLPADRPEWSRASRFLDRCQNRELLSRERAAREREAAFRDGGFAFMPRFSKAGFAYTSDEIEVEGSYGSATADGTRGLLAISGGDFREERALAALRWLARSFTVERNPGFGEQDFGGWSRGIHFYWLASCARAFDAAKVDAIRTKEGERSWPGEVARSLVNAQSPSGTWASRSGLMAEDSPTVATSLALLALASARDRLRASASRKDGRVLEGGEGPPPPPPELSPWEPAAASVLERGRAVFATLQCAGCHQDGANVNGPSLVGMADRYLERKRTHDAAADYLSRHVREPARFPGLNGRDWGEHRMPGFGAASGLRDEELSQLVEFLLSRRGDLPVSEARTPR